MTSMMGKSSQAGYALDFKQSGSVNVLKETL